jgi:hypothetical protein
MSRVVFPYGIRFQEDGIIDVFPMAELDVLGKGGVGIRAAFHIDSGATTSVLPADDGEALGLGIKQGKKILVRGILGVAAKGYVHEVTVQLEAIRFRIPVIFVLDTVVPRILGRAGVFPRFAIVFDEIKQRTALLDARKDRKNINLMFSNT